MVDNTFLSPILQRPFLHGADIVLHSVTKFLNGHADVVGGVLVFRDQELMKKVRGFPTTWEVQWILTRPGWFSRGSNEDLVADLEQALDVLV